MDVRGEISDNEDITWNFNFFRQKFRKDKGLVSPQVFIDEFDQHLDPLQQEASPLLEEGIPKPADSELQSRWIQWQVLQQQRMQRSRSMSDDETTDEEGPLSSKVPLPFIQIDRRTRLWCNLVRFTSVLLIFLGICEFALSFSILVQTRHYLPSTSSFETHHIQLHGPVAHEFHWSLTPLLRRCAWGELLLSIFGIILSIWSLRGVNKRLSSPSGSKLMLNRVLRWGPILLWCFCAIALLLPTALIALNHQPHITKFSVIQDWKNHLNQLGRSRNRGITADDYDIELDASSIALATALTVLAGASTISLLISCCGAWFVHPGSNITSSSQHPHSSPSTSNLLSPQQPLPPTITIDDEGETNYQGLLINHLVLGILGSMLLGFSLYSSYHSQSTPLSLVEILGIKVVGFLLIFLTILGLVRMVSWNRNREKQKELLFLASLAHALALPDEENPSHSSNSVSSPFVSHSTSLSPVPSYLLPPSALQLKEQRHDDIDDYAAAVEAETVLRKEKAMVHSLSMNSLQKNFKLYQRRFLDRWGNNSLSFAQLHRPCQGRMLVILHVAILIWLTITMGMMTVSLLLRSATLSHYWSDRINGNDTTETDSWFSILSLLPWFATPRLATFSLHAESALEASTLAADTNNPIGRVNWLLVISEKKLAMLTALSLFITFFSAVGALYAIQMDSILIQNEKSQQQQQGHPQIELSRPQSSDKDSEELVKN